MNKGYYHLCTGGELLANKMKIAYQENVMISLTLKELLPGLHPDLKSAKETLDAAQKYLDGVAERVRKECEHKYIVEAPYKPGEWFTSQSPFRICLICRREEHAWSFHKGATISDGPTQFHGKCELYAEPVATISRNELYGMRI